MEVDYLNARLVTSTPVVEPVQELAEEYAEAHADTHAEAHVDEPESKQCFQFFFILA